jgi:hypothetical protein
MWPECCKATVPLIVFLRRAAVLCKRVFTGTVQSRGGVAEWTIRLFRVGRRQPAKSLSG